MFFQLLLYLPTSLFQAILGFGDPLAKHGMCNALPAITSTSFSGFCIHAGGTAKVR